MTDTTIDYDRLNEQATILYNTAAADGFRDGEEQGRNESSIYHSLDKLKYVGMLAVLAETMESMPETQRTLVSIIRNILDGVSHFNAEHEIHTARNACGTTGFLPDISKIIEYAEKAEALLRMRQES